MVNGQSEIYALLRGSKTFVAKGFSPLNKMKLFSRTPKGFRFDEVNYRTYKSAPKGSFGATQRTMIRVAKADNIKIISKHLFNCSIWKTKPKKTRKRK